jgi:hypothetical protein
MHKRTGQRGHTNALASADAQTHWSAHMDKIQGQMHNHLAGPFEDSPGRNPPETRPNQITIQRFFEVRENMRSVAQDGNTDRSARFGVRHTVTFQDPGSIQE